MAEYYYCKYKKAWRNLTWNTLEGGDVSNEKIDELRHARSNKKFIIVKNRYGGIRTKYIYIDIDNFKLNLNNGKKFYFVIKDNFSLSRSIYSAGEIKNLSVILNTPEDVKFASDYVYTCSTCGSYPRGEDEELKNKAISELSDIAKLYYEMDPRPPFRN